MLHPPFLLLFLVLILHTKLKLLLLAFLSLLLLFTTWHSSLQESQNFIFPAFIDLQVAIRSFPQLHFYTSNQLLLHTIPFLLLCCIPHSYFCIFFSSFCYSTQSDIVTACFPRHTAVVHKCPLLFAGKPKPFFPSLHWLTSSYTFLSSLHCFTSAPAVAFNSILAFILHLPFLLLHHIFLSLWLHMKPSLTYRWSYPPFLIS